MKPKITGWAICSHWGHLSYVRSLRRQSIGDFLKDVHDGPWRVVKSRWRLRVVRVEIREVRR